MDDLLARYDKYLDRWLELAAHASNEEERRVLLEMARRCQREAGIVAKSQALIAESNELLEGAKAVLSWGV
jgi:hypothetical protein